ncbi:MAG: low molecular weight protein arginine phosphatase [Actinomycetota bacterium]
MNKILFVCTANVCRSPMAEAIFNTLAEDARLPLRAESAGLHALRGELMAGDARAVLAELGIRTREHRARQLEARMLEDAALVLTMNTQHAAEIRRIFGDPDYKVFTLPEYAGGGTGQKEISDPYGHTRTAFRASARQIVEYVDMLVTILSSRQRTRAQTAPGDAR